MDRRRGATKRDVILIFLILIALLLLARPFAAPSMAPAAVTDLRVMSRQLFAPLPMDMAAPGAPIIPAQARLGRLLFFEPRVSSDGVVSCAHCHQPSLYGVDALPKSIGAEHRVHPRHSPTVLNSALQFVQHWRGDRASVEEQAVKALTAPFAFGNANVDVALAKLKRIPGYRQRFAEAFPGHNEPITADAWGTAIGAYMRTLVTPAPFDAYLKGDDAALSSSQQAGLEVFIRLGCAGCHNGVGVGGGLYQKFGIKENYWVATGSTTIDKGRFEVTQNPNDLYVFKVPMLRNVAVTPPYFHDGSVATLPEAIRIMGRVQLGRSLSEPDIQSIVAFLEALTGEMPSSLITVPTLPIAGRGVTP